MSSPWEPAVFDIADAAAIKALAAGTANADQQVRALLWIVETASGAYDQSYYPGGEDGRRNTDFAEGKRFVGNSIIKLTKVNLDSLRRDSK